MQEFVFASEVKSISSSLSSVVDIAFLFRTGRRRFRFLDVAADIFRFLYGGSSVLSIISMSESLFSLSVCCIKMYMWIMTNMQPNMCLNALVVTVLLIEMLHGYVL